MDIRSGSRAVELALIAVIVVGAALNVAVLSSSIPIFEGLYARTGLALPLPLELYVRAGNAAVVGPLTVLVVLGMSAYFGASISSARNRRVSSFGALRTSP